MARTRSYPGQDVPLDYPYQRPPGWTQRADQRSQLHSAPVKPVPFLVWTLVE